MHILVTGGTGFLGRQLYRQLRAAGHQLTVLSRNPATVASHLGEGVASWKSLDEWTPDLHLDAVINLAGAPIMDRRWTEARKKVLWDSRVTLTENLVTAMQRADVQPAVLISGSAIGAYGDCGDDILDETASGRDGFGQRLCLAWESAAAKAATKSTRVCILRTGLVIGSDGGFLNRLLPAFRLGLGGPIGDGRQWMSWIHRTDHIALTQFLLETPSLSGIFNATAPGPVTNAEFTRTLARQLRRPAFLRLPAGLLRLAAGEMASLLLGSQRVLPRRALEAGFRFKYPELEAALEDVISAR